MLSNQIFRDPGWLHPHTMRLHKGLMLCREDTGQEHPFLYILRVLAAHQGGGSRAEQVALHHGSLGFRCWGAAGQELGAELLWEQRAVLHCHPKLRLSESVFLLF